VSFSAETTLDDDSAEDAVAGDERPLGADTLGKRAKHTTVISTGQYVIGQGVRFVGNIILARLLFPDAFGVMNLLTVFMQGLQMFSDVGIRAAIVQHQRGNDPVFLNTMWTLQVIRGIGIWLVAIPLGFVAASFYNNPMLAFYMPVMACAALVDGFQSTAVHTADRNLQIGRLALLRISTQLFKVTFMVVAAYFYRDIWVLVIGNVLHVVLETIGSHVFLGSVRNRFCWDAASRRAVSKFGRWIFIATMLTFLASRGDALILGRVMSSTEFGLFSIAYSLAFLLPQALVNLSSSMLFSLYARLMELDMTRLAARTSKMRLLILLAGLPPIWFLSLAAQPIVSLLYDERYSNPSRGLGMATMITILCVGAAVRVINAGMMPLLLATGNSFGHMLMTAIEMISLVTCMAIGGTYGPQGLLIGLSVSHMICYPFLAFAAARHGIWFGMMDGIAAVLSVIVFAIAFTFTFSPAADSTWHDRDSSTASAATEVDETLVSAPAEEDSGHSKHHQFQIEQQSSLIDVLDIHQNLLLEPDIASATHLPDARKPRFDLKPAAIKSRVEFDFVRDGRSRAYEAHVATDDVPELRELIDAETSNEPPDAGHSWIVRNLERALIVMMIEMCKIQLATVSVRDHRAELVELKEASVASNAGLAKEDRTKVCEFDPERDDDQQRR